jgi:hypothetical protein
VREHAWGARAQRRSAAAADRFGLELFLLARGEAHRAHLFRLLHPVGIDDEGGNLVEALPGVISVIITME